MTKSHKALLNRFPVGVPVFRSKMESECGKMPGFASSLTWLIKNRLIDVTDKDKQILRRRTTQEIADMVTNQAATKGIVK